MTARPSSARPVVVVVGQTPPPVHGQALAIERLVEADFERITVHHVRMDFSDSMGAVGRFEPGKVGKLLRLILRVLKARRATGSRVLYYPPAGPTLVPVLRDIVFLTVVRPFFPVVVFEFHAGGLERMEGRLVAPLRWLFRHAYHRPALIVEKHPPEPGSERFRARRRLVVPNGADDEFPRFMGSGQAHDGFRVLYVGVVTPMKGIWTFLDGLSELVDRGVDVRAVVVGEFSSERIAAEWATVLRRRGMEDRVRHTGGLVGDAKWREFRDADTFFFPSLHEETCPLAIIEAMQFRLPVVASNRAGMAYLVRDGETGFLVPPANARAAADRLEHLASDPGLRERMGARARQVYLERYTGEAYLTAMEKALQSVADQPAG